MGLADIVASEDDGVFETVDYDKLKVCIQKKYLWVSFRRGYEVST